MLTIILGPMFSGKSTELLRRIGRVKAIGIRYTLINHTLDQQRSPGVTTHSRQSMDAVSLTALMPFISSVGFSESDYIFINEAQFFVDLREFCKTCGESHPSKNIVLCGLDGDSNQRTFGQLCDCIPLATEVTKLSALCQECADGTCAPFTIRKESRGPVVVVGGSDVYTAVCRVHLNMASPEKQHVH